MKSKVVNNIAFTAVGVGFGFLIMASSMLYTERNSAEVYAQDKPKEVTVVWEHTEVVKYEPVTADDVKIILPEDVAELEGFERDACLLAQMAWGESRGMDTYERSLSMWCALNRVDSSRFPNTIEAVVKAPYQFVGYKASNPVDSELYELAKDVLVRWWAEKNGVENVGRTLPSEYLFFYGKNGHNWYRKTNSGAGRYDFTDILPSPY
jgi:hypothetical protein